MSCQASPVADLHRKHFVTYMYLPYSFYIYPSDVKTRGNEKHNRVEILSQDFGMKDCNL